MNSIFSDIGWVAMHSALGDAEEDVWALFKSSRFGSFSHSHADQNTFQLNAYGRALLIDSDYYPWYGSPHDQLWTRQTRAHNGILVNGRGVRAVALDSPSGNFIDGYKLDIPTYVFKPGTNTIEFAANLHAPGQVCDLIQPDGLFLTVYGNSTISFPPMPHFVEMPRLELFMHSGFPITRWPDGHEAWIWLTEKDDRVLAAALNVIGVATQRNGFPLFEMAFTHERPAAEGEVLVVGRMASLGAELLKAAPLRVVDGETRALRRTGNTEEQSGKGPGIK